MVIAEVVIANNSRELDKKFSYIVPEKMNAMPGARVIVPFGRGNKSIEGIITGYSSNDNFTGLKEIKQLIDEKPLCTPKLLELAEYIRNRCICTYYQALRLVVAPASKIKTTRWISLLDDDIDINAICGRSLAKKEFIQRLINAGGTVDYGTVADISNVSAIIREFEKADIITLDDKVAQNVGSKQIRMVCINTELAYDDEMPNTLKRAPKQLKMIEILKQTGDISVADLVEFSNSSYSAVSSLEQKGFVKIYDKIVPRTVIDINKHIRSQKKELTDEQSYVLENLINNYNSSDKKPSLIRGVTGSGKTEVFLQIIDYFQKQGKQAVVLVPEISLTPQMVGRFVERFGRKVSVLHSGLSVGEKYDEWKRILNSEVEVVVGARSAVFAPFNNLGIIIIDEEHEATYKADNVPSYDARDIAAFRSKNEGAMLVLASATPSVNSYFYAKSGKYNLYEMANRHNKMPMPNIHITDMREELKNGNYSVFSNMLKNEMDKNIKDGQQTILFLNRRGFNSFVMCRSCGEAIMCRNCSISMTYHKNTDSLKCHYCGYECETPKICPECGSNHIRFMGTGTEKIEEELRRLYGEDSFIRMDADTTSGKNSHEIILNRFQNDKIPILLGTQMVTKGLDFENVTLVGVLAADMSLNVDDFRASERTFCQITQVCGRAGRGILEGRAVVQTYQPEHYAISFAKSHNYTGFYDSEIQIRKQLKNPPYNDLILIMMQGDDEGSVKYELGRIANRLKSRGLNILGPVPSPYGRIKNKYRWRILIKNENAMELADLFRKISDYYAKSKNSLYIDINPNSMN